MKNIDTLPLNGFYLLMLLIIMADWLFRYLLLYYLLCNTFNLSIILFLYLLELFFTIHSLLKSFEGAHGLAKWHKL